MIILAATVVFASSVLLPERYLGPVFGVIVALAISAVVLRSPQALHLTLCCVFVGIAAALPLPRLGLLSFGLALLAYALVVRSVGVLRSTSGWARRGRLDRTTFWMIGATIIVSSAGLGAWFALSDADLSDFRALVPDLPPAALVAAGLAFALANAAVEEAMFRGVFLEALDSAAGAGHAAVVLQAAVFGMMHIEGFPRGPSGILLSFLYGLMLGAIRRQSQGLLAPWLAHVAADVVIFALLVLFVRP